MITPEKIDSLRQRIDAKLNRPSTGLTNTEECELAQAQIYLSTARGALLNKDYGDPHDLFTRAKRIYNSIP